MNAIELFDWRWWSWDPALLVVATIAAAAYGRGWRRLRHRDPRRWHVGQPLAFGGGLAAILLALAAPIETAAFLLLKVHMAQHLLLTMVAPPLVWLGEPLAPLVNGLPGSLRRTLVAGLMRDRAMRSLTGCLVHPPVAWTLMVVVVWTWHVPNLYESALRDGFWHRVEHGCFLLAGLVFWWPVVRPFPARVGWSRWWLIPYLLLADVSNTALAALLAFSSNVIYPHYANLPRVGSLAALEDQATAGALMWIPGSLIYLAPAAWIARDLLFGRSERKTVRVAAPAVPTSRQPKGEALPTLPVIGPSTALAAGRRAAQSPGLAGPLVAAAPAGFDLLRLPGVRGFVRWRYARPAVQAVFLLAAAAIVLDGLFGPPIAPLNLAGVVPWIHWRGFVVLGLLAVGNVFCFGCPFLLPRMLARRMRLPQRPWPRALRSKWLAVGLLAAFLWAYEALALWNSPWLTAWIVLAYFTAALLIDAAFRDAAFCKYVCPVGQFNFVQSLVSPWEVRVRQSEQCADCATRDCIRGSATSPGCELHLFQPRKAGNLDCTFCLDCVRACPHDNVGLLPTAPGRVLWSDPMRSGLGRLSNRADVAALVLVLVFGAFANAAGMVAPVVAWHERLAARWGLASTLPVITASYAAALLAAPLLAIAAATTLSRLACVAGTWRQTAIRYSLALAPLGCAMWLAHYSFHLLTSAAAIGPPLARSAAVLGWTAPSFGAAACDCCATVADWLLRLEILMLDTGLLLSLYAAWRIARQRAAGLKRALGAFAPWAALMTALFVLGIWILFQPMEMRGTLQMIP